MKTNINLLFSVFLSAFLIASASSKRDCPTGKKSSSKLICYYGNLDEINGCYCTHVIVPSNSDVKNIERVRSEAKGVKIFVSVNEFNQGLINLLKDTKVDGLEINLKKLDSKNDITDFISTVKTKIGSDLDIVLSVPSKGDLVAKYFDFKALSKYADLFILQTAFLGASTNVTFHPSRLSGMWDMQNTDSVVDLVSGLGAPLSKLVIVAPVQAFKFTLQSEEYTAPGSPALELSSITREELCRLMQGGKNWTLERDEDQAGPYIFSKNQWIAFEDSKSMDIKAKYARIRGLAGLALKDLGQDGGSKCGYNILEAAYNGLSRQARAPRGAVLHSLEREILENPVKPLDSVQLSPYKISRIIDTEGKIHVIRQDSRTEFQCSRQGYFVHPRSCNRFYRCVKFNQHTEDYNVFEFDCPAGLAFDERVEVCVWPGSLPHGTPCSGSSEIAPVPRERFVCPSEPGYYADPENCRWFFACLDHGKSPLSAYEFRCPFGLVFDGDRLVCEWPWLVPRCASGLGVGIDSAYSYGTAGYTGKISGVIPGGVILQNYDGFGALGTVKLGGLSGQIEKPISTVYSNVDGSVLGSGYRNDGGYIIGGGLSYKAVQSLQNAGLLKVNNGAGYQFSGQNQQTSAHASQSNANAYVTGQVNSQYSGAFGGQSQAGSGYHHEEYNDGRYYAGSSASGAGYSGNSGAVSSQSFTQYHGQSGQGVEASADLYKVNAANSQYQNNEQDSLYGTTYSGNGAVTSSYSFGGQYRGHTDQSSIGADNLHGSVLSTAYSGNSGGVSSQNLDGQYKVQIQEGNSGSGTYNQANGYIVNGKLDAGFVNGIGAGGVAYVQSGQSGSYENNVQHKDNSQAYGQLNSAGYVAVGVAGSDQISGLNLAQNQQTLTQLHGQEGGASYNNGGQGFVSISGDAGYQGKDNLDVNAGYTFGNKYVDGVAGQGYVKYSPSSGEGGVSSQSFVQYHGSEGGKIYTSSEASAINQYRGDVKYNIASGVDGNVNIVGGGYSAVGSVSDIQLLNNGEADDLKTFSYSSTPAPVAVTTFAPAPVISSIPTVTSVPVPGIKTNVGFETFKGGVIANIPELQYKVQSHSDLGLLNISSGFANVVVTTPGSIPSYQQTYSTDGEYVYNKPVNNIQISTARPFVSVNTEEPKVYISSTVKPVTIDEEYVKEGVIYNQPGVTYSTYKPSPVASAVSSVSFQKYNSNEGYKYEKPSVVFEQKPQVNVQTYSTVSTAKPTVLLEQQPQVYVSSTSETPAVSSYSFAQETNQNKGYVYDKPSISFENAHNLPTVISKFSIRRPEVQQTLNTGAYYYESEHGKQNSVLETYAHQQPAVVSHYRYQQPFVQPVQPVVPLVKQPELLSTYTYQQPTQSTVYKQPSSIYTYQNVALQAAAISQNSQPNYSSQSNGGTSYQHIKFDNDLRQQSINVQKQGYIYQKPSVVYEEKTVVSSTPQPQIILEQQAQAIDISQKPQPNYPYQYNGGTSYQNIKFDNDLKQQSINIQKQGYVYQKPAVVFEETPVVSSTPQPQVILEQQNVGYSYPKPTITFEETPVKPVIPVQPAAVTSYFNIGTSKPEIYVNQEEKVGYSYPKPAIKFEETPITYTTARPTQPSVATSYFSISSSTAKPKVIVEQEKIGYTYPKPFVKFEETPVTYSTPKPVVVVRPTTQPAVVTSYFNVGSSTPAPEIYIKKQTTGYSYPKPEVQFQEVPITYSTPKPAVIPSYNFISSTSPQPSIVVEEQEPIHYNVVPSSPRPSILEEHKPAVVTSYFNIKPSTGVKGYRYPKPAVSFEEEPQGILTSYENKNPVFEEPFIKKTAYVTGQYQQNNEANYQQSGHFSVGNYEFPEHEKVKEVVFGEKILHNQAEIQYHQPEVLVKYVQSTPKPTLISTVQAIASKKFEPVTPATVTVYDSHFSSTPESYVSSTLAPEINIIGSTRRPVSKFSFTSDADEYQYNQYIDLVKSTTPQPGRTYLPVTSTIKVTSALPKITRTKVVETYVAPDITTIGKEYLPAQTPSSQYLPVEVTTPSKAYLPVRQSAKYTSTPTPVVTTLAKEYLPVRTRVRVTTAAPVEPIKIYNPVTVIKQNDAHPLLSTKLGAQCTCVSNNLRLRKKQKIIVVEDDGEDDDDGYIVDNAGPRRVVESYNAAPETVVEITPTPEVYVASSTLAPKGYALKKRVKVRPYNPVTELSEIFVEKDITLAEDGPSDKEVAKAIRTGLKLVKQAAKEGANEALSKAFDRYGPGGVRSRSETLQGTIDCQRAGLFRHPTECNKFYACRWDCTKNRFTLHVFNCPVHLTFDNNLGACNWPSQGPACVENTLITSD